MTLMLMIILTRPPTVLLPVLGYVGPGAGLGLFSALIGVVVALGSAVFFILAWPIRKLMKKRRGGPTGKGQEPPADAGPSI
jgi:hypothetical protein